MYEKGGIAPPNSWSDVVVRRLEAQGSGSCSPGRWKTFSSTDLLFAVYYEFGSRLAQLGGKFVDENGKAAFNSDGKKSLSCINSYDDLRYA